MVAFLIQLLVICLVAGLVYYLVTEVIPLPPKLVKFIVVVLIVIVVLYISFGLLNLAGVSTGGFPRTG